MMYPSKKMQANICFLVQVFSVFFSGFSMAGEDRAQSSTKNKPNILMILVDDLGYSDLGVYGGDVATPNLDRLAGQGILFTNAHAYPSCAPTRAGLLTGKDPHKVGLGSQGGFTPPGVPVTTPGYKGSLEGEFTGISEVLKRAGYATFQVGKWHLGFEDAQSPRALGFDMNYTLLDGAASHYNDMKGVSPSLEISPGREGQANGDAQYLDGVEPVDNLPADFYSTRFYTQKAIDFIGAAAQGDKPFFGYLAYTAVHDPLHAPADLIEKYAALYQDGYEELKEDRVAGMIKEGLIADTALPARWLAGTPRWADLTALEKQDLNKRLAVYAAMLDYLDQQIGRLLETLKQKNLFDNTIIVVMSDNGAAPVPRTVYARNASGLEWQAKTFPLHSIRDYGKKGSFPTLGIYNSLAVSGPFFGFKTNLHEGGTRVPMLVKLPQKTEAGVSDAFVHITDLYPTFSEYGGADLTDQKDLVGCSLRSLFEGADSGRCKQDFGIEYLGWRALRDGDWKLIFVSESFGGTGKYALYNLADDPGEMHDLSSLYPDKVSDLATRWEEYADKNGVKVSPMEAVNARFDAIASRFLDVHWGQK